ncbi:hypothetical protein [Deinococcus radiophilus]|uniref:hypothetical protein n=1 Tax=Deinococcus radiophilus TaxID=32062 RepID=UPI00360BE66B
MQQPAVPPAFMSTLVSILMTAQTCNAQAARPATDPLPWRMLISGVGSGTLTGTPLDQPPSTPAQVLLVPKKVASRWPLGVRRAAAGLGGAKWRSGD